MDTLECIRTRRSIRKYLEKPVAWDDVSKILEAGRFAPNAGNLQNWKFVVVLDFEKRRKLAEAALQQYWMETAPVHIVICSEPHKAEKYYGIRGERLYSIQNCAAAATNMLLAAHAIGLSGCWVGAFDEDMVSRAINLVESEGARPQIILTIGYADEKAATPSRQPVEAIMFFNNWRGRIKDVPGYFNFYGESIRKKIKEKAGEIKRRVKQEIEKRKEK
jgi:nitroreductase